jgi:CHASE2 domain-containing sensor protein
MIDQLKTEYYWVDYGAAQSLQDQLSQAAAFGEHASLNINHAVTGFQKRVVLLGNTQWEVTPDKYPIPPWETETPGVFFHASGVYTLIKGPLRKITWEGQLVLDPLIVLLLAFLLHRLWRKKKTATQKHSMRWSTNWVILLLIAVFGFGLVRTTRILWTDWLWACLAVLIQGWLEEHLEPYVERERQRNPKVWYRFIFVLIDGGKE